MSTEFQTLATHLAGKDVEIVFETRNSCPRVEYSGKAGETPIVYLPASLNRRFIYPTIAATLHETHHIKETNVEQYKVLINTYKRSDCSIVCRLADHIVNVVEDIRIDMKVFDEFCNAHQLYEFLMDEAMSLKNGEKDDPINHFGPMLLDYIYFRAIGFEQYFNKPLAKKFFGSESIINAINAAISKAKDAQTTSDIYRSCDIIVDIIKKFYKSEKVKQEMKQKQQQAIANARQKQVEAQEAASKAMHEKNSVKNKIDKLYEKQNKMYTDISKFRDEQSKKGKSRSDIDTSKEYSDMQKESNELSNKIEDLSKQKSKAQNDVYNNESEASRQKSMADAIQNDEKQSVVEDLIADTYGYGTGNIGFNTINRLFKLNKPEKMPEFTENIKTIFSRMSSKPINSEQTGNINVKNIYKIFNSENTDLRDIFKTNRFRSSYNNKLAILLDTSGSMEKKYDLLFETVSSLLKIIDENKETYNIDTAIASYSSETKFFKKFGEEKSIDYEKMYNQFYEERLIMNGGTEIINALNTMQDHIDEEATHKDNKYMIVFTDCVFGSQDMKVILDKFNAEREKIIFIGLGSIDRFKKFNREWNSTTYKNGKARYKLSNTGKLFFEKILFKRMVNCKGKLEQVLLEGFDRIIDR